MNKLIIAFTLMSSVLLNNNSCAQTKTDEFASYLKSLNNISFPFSLYSWNNTMLNLSPRNSLSGFTTFKNVGATKPGGIILKNKNYVVLMDFGIGDGGMDPFLTSYDISGNKIDSLKPFTKTSADQGFFASERLIISRDQKVTILDTTKTWKDDGNGKTIKNSVKIKPGKTIYLLNNKGKFTKPLE